MSPVLGQKVLVVGVGLKSDPIYEIKENLVELEDLIVAAGGEVVGSLTQVLQSWNPATLIGSGKILEIKSLLIETQANLVVVDHTLGGVQTRNLEKEFSTKVLDRNQVIIDIFAQRAQTFEGKLQVELAQALDQMPRMVNAWMGSLSRLGGGIGTRGPGEKAIELDRRKIRERIGLIRKKLEGVRKNRSHHRSSRQRHEIPSFALIGYTNTGKSTLLNALTGANAQIKNQVFATLDPTTRKIFLPQGPPSVVTDTVGFIRKLPPQLIEAFKATLEESAEADILIHVIDLANPAMERQIEVVEDLIQEFKWDTKPILHVYNKMDIASPETRFKANRYPRIFISAAKNEGLEQLKSMMAETISGLQQDVELFFTKSQEHLIFDLGRDSRILRKEQASEGTVCFAQMTPTVLSKWRDWLVTKE